MNNQELPGLSRFNALDLKILLAGELEAGPEWRFLRHPGTLNRLYLIMEGNGWVGDSRGKYPFAPGRILLCPIGKTLDYVCTRRLHKIYLHLRLELFPGRDVFRGLDQVGVARGRIDEFRDLSGAFRRGTPADLARAKAWVLQTLSPFIPAMEDSAPARMERYRPLFAWVDGHLSPHPKAKDLAPLLDLAPSTLVKNFRRDLGLSLDRYVDGRIIARAKDEMTFGMPRVKDLARKLGFEDEFYFSRFFKKHAGVSPQDFGRRQRMGGP